MTNESSNACAADATLVDPAANGRRARFSDKWLFFRKFIEKGRTISSAVPSSTSLVAGVLRRVDFTRPATIVELGAGTGAVTTEIVARLRPFHRFVAVENDPDFCNILRRRFPETLLLQADASEIAKPLADMGIHKVDYILSGLPTPNLSAKATVRLWRWLHHALAPEGLFIQITIAPLVYRKFYDRLFDSVEYRMVWRNLPPGGVYWCAKPRPHLSVPR